MKALICSLHALREKLGRTYFLSTTEQDCAESVLAVLLQQKAKSRRYMRVVFYYDVHELDLNLPDSQCALNFVKNLMLGAVQTPSQQTSGSTEQVMKFWAKAERVVTYKNKSVADARKKEVMDKHLTYLVGQTQRYSSMLAQRLHSGQPHALPIPCFYCLKHVTSFTMSMLI